MAAHPSKPLLHSGKSDTILNAETGKMPTSTSSNLSLHSTIGMAVPTSDPLGKTSDKPTATSPSATSASPASRASPGGMQAPIKISRARFWVVFLSLLVSVFLFALDQLIIATALPKITVEFGALTQLPWLANGFFLTLFGFNLLYSQWTAIFPSKHVIMFAISVFEIGSLLCGVAPSIEVLILGRAVAGAGAAGIFSGAMVIIAEMTALHERAQYMGLFGVCFAIASIIGPLVGGAFSDHVSWRWCFYINLPLGGVALALQAVFQPTSAPLGRAATYKGYSRAMIWQVVRCDWLGGAIAMAWGCCLILALQWGGIERPWSDGGVIACLVLIGVLPPVFVAWEWYIGDKAMFKLELIKRRTVAGSACVLFFNFATMMLEVYYLSLAFQAVYDSSATMAGVKLLPLILVQVVVLILSSRIIPRIGRFKWVIVAGPVFITIASGLMYTVKYGTPQQHLYGFQALLGIGIGLAMQNSMLAVQFDLKDQPRLIPAGTGLVVFIGFAGRIVGISLAGSVFGNTLQTNLSKYTPALPSALASAILNDASAIWNVVPDSLREGVLMAYTETLRNVYIIGVPCGILAVLGGLAIKNSKMQSKEQEEEAIRKAREIEERRGEKEADLGGEEEVVRAETMGVRETREVEGISAVAPLPAAAVPVVKT